MAKTPSNMLPLGFQLFPFELQDCFGKIHSLQTVSDKPRLLAFICSHCPYVVHLKSSLGEFSRLFADKIHMFAINSNDTEKYPQDGVAAMKNDLQMFDYAFPFLLDTTQDIAKRLDAACTPDFYLFDASGALRYRGQYDSSRPGLAIPVSGVDLRTAVESLLQGQLPSENQKPSLGCNIKWKES